MKKRPLLAYVCQYIFAPDARDLGIDVLRCLVKNHCDIVVFTQARGVGVGVRRWEREGMGVWAIDFDRRAAFFLDRLFKRLLGVRKFMTDLQALRRFFKETKPDAVLVEGVFPWGLIAWGAALGLPYGRNVVVTRHTPDALNVPFDYYDRNRSRLIAWCSRLVYRRFTIRANSPMTAQWVRDSGAPAANVRMVPVNISAAFDYQPVIKPLVPRRRFVSASRLAPVKALDQLIIAFKGVVRQYPDALLDLYGLARRIPGIGDYRAHLEWVITSEGLEGSVALRGEIPRDQVAKVLADYDFHIAASHGETLNLVVAEAASRGIPSIVTQYTGIADWVRAHGAGMVVPSSAPELEAAMVRACALSDADYTAMRAGCHGVWAAFTPEAVCAGLTALFQEVAPQDSWRGKEGE